MECTVIIVTHGKLANELVATSSLLIGRQDSVVTVEFMPGENLESLIKKLAGIIETLAKNMAVLFVVDMVSGSPFNACAYFTKNRKATRLVAGVNIPMLVNILLERQEILNLDDLVELAVSVGRSAVKKL